MTAVRRPWYRVALHWVRRGHLYCGLFLLPWVVLYGVTAFLFNHPAAFPDQPHVTFGREPFGDAPLPSADALAAEVVAALNQRATTNRYALATPSEARFSRDNAFATAKGDGVEANILLDVTGSGGTIRTRPPAATAEPAPFAVKGKPGEGRGKRGGGDEPRPADGVKLARPLHERMQAAAKAVADAHGLTGPVALTSVPDVTFAMTDGERTWRVLFNDLTGTVSGQPADAGSEVSARTFLLRLHLAHGYPSGGARWWWAVAVDAMAATMLFWAVSGVLMWWQIKATRWPGVAVLVVSAACAGWVGVGMHAMIAVGR